MKKPPLDIISMTPLFNGLSRDELEKISEIAVYRDFQKNAPIFWEGDPADGFFIVAEGRVKVFKSSGDGKEQILHILGPGEPFGEVPVFSGGSFPAGAQSMPDARTLFIKRASFLDLISKNPSLAMNMLGVLALRLRQFTVQVENLSLKEVPGRLAAYLAYLSEKENNAVAVRLDISKGQLAGLLGTIPETLSRIFSKMTQSGLIRVRGSDIEILDMEGLRQKAGL
ncbi:Transcriptional regulator [Candidatus Desulfarcum epimagneticum]|uniref:Transcriptional regulator n=1 Tax=uncultured Desulfobacteraceae bacterium TaxID=218296 RepID=A0A484HQ42_9BACT|nr:Transcriptional regulator [uncultured Desulfobacteraceae bacterium]